MRGSDGPNLNKNRQDQIEKFVKLMDHISACNDLTSFESEAHAKTGNGSYENMQKLIWKNREITWG